jgi:hypothetical protein
MYVVPRGDMLAEYGLPSDPNVKKNTSFIGLLRNTRRLGAAATWAGILGLALYWLRYGRHAPPPEDAGAEEAVLVGEHGGNGQVVEGLGANAPAPADGNGHSVEGPPVEEQPVVTSDGKELS